MNLLKKVTDTIFTGTNGTSQQDTTGSANGNGKFISGERFSLLLDSIPSVITYVDRNHYLQYVNKAFEKMFDQDCHSVLGKPIADFLGKEAYHTIKKYIEAALSGRQVHYEMEVPLKEGKRYIEATYTPDVDEDGNVAGYIGLINDISEKKRTETELKRKQLELQDYVDNGTVGLHWVDAGGIITWANKAELSMLGYSPEEYIGHHIAEFHADKDKINDILTRLLCNETLYQYEAELWHKDGSLRTVLINSNVLWEDGRFIHTRCFTTDITDRKQMEDALQESEAHHRALMENLPAALYTCDAKGRITLFNKAAADLWGREPEIGKDMWCGSWKIYQPDGITPMELDTCPMAITLKEGRPVTGKEIVIERPDGQRRNVQPYPVPIFDKKGKIAGAVNMLLDITDRKITEKDLAHLAAIVHSSSDPIISKTLTGIITSWNEAAERLFGYTADEMIGQSLLKLFPEDRLNEEKLILERLKKGEMVEHFETKRITKDKKLLDISLTISPVKDSGGNVIGASKIARDITAQRALHEALRESEERLRMAVESTKMGTWEFFPLTGLLTWSRECKQIYDVPDDLEVDYAFFSKHIHPEDADFAQEAIQKAMDPGGEGKYDIQYRILRYSDKQPKWIRAQGKVYFNLNGQAERFIGTVLDINEEKTREQELKNSVELFATMADNVPAMIWMSGDDKFCDFFNNTWLEFTGRTIAQESNEGWLENVHPDDVQKCIDNYHRSFNEQKGFYTEYRLKRQDGRYRWVADNSVPRHNSDGSFAGFISACMDIDDQKNFREKIMESELQLKTISNASPVGLWMTDINGQNIFVNDTWIEWTGIPFEKQLGAGWLDRVLEEDKAEAPSKFVECLLKKEKYSTEFRIIRPDGELRWCLTEGSPYYNIDGEFAGYAGSVTDITDMKKMEERKDDFIKMASHELKTPITSIKGYVQLLLNIYDGMNEEKFQASRPTVKSSLNTISKQVSKLTRLVSELLDLSRIESGKLELHKTEFDLGELVEETVQDVRHTTSQHAIIIHNDFEGNIFADKDRISQVLLNLLTNAIKYSPDADNVEVYLEGNKEMVTIKVKDHGIGIDKKDHDRIFQRFYRVEGKSEQTYPGFGIGLFIASEIVQRHAGSIFVESKKNKGAVFTVTLPLVLKK